MAETDLAKAFDLEQPADVRLATALVGTLELIRKAQERLCAHLRPDGPDDDRECLEELLEMFDGPRQRAIESAARSAQRADRAEDATEYVLAQINAELKAQLIGIRDVIPMSFLKKNDAAGAPGPTDELDVAGAVRDMTEEGRKLKALNAELVQALSASLVESRKRYGSSTEAQECFESEYAQAIAALSKAESEAS